MRRLALDPDLVLAEVTEFATLARKGAYLAGDRRVSPRERTRWRLTFRRLAAQALDALGGDRVQPAAAAVSVLIDVACESRDVDYFRSDDPVEAARFVVSDAVRALWVRAREVDGPRFAQRAAEQLLRWESEYGWTRRGDGWVAARETALARVLTDLLVVPDLWGSVTAHYPRTHRTPRRRTDTPWRNRVISWVFTASSMVGLPWSRARLAWWTT